MNKEEIQKAFEGRWRLKSDFGKINNNSATMSFDEFYDYLKGLCFDFFEAGIFLADKDMVKVTIDRQPITIEDCVVTETEESTFDIWWNLYDKKRSREKCEKKWAKMTPQERIDCINATPAYVSSTEDKQYRKDPYTYLNNKSWKDEIIVRSTPEQQRQQRLAEVAERIAGYTKTTK